VKFTVTMKDPDVLHDAIRDAVKEAVAAEFPTASKEDREMLAVSRERFAQEVAGRWFEYSEYLVVEIDTEAQTCTVLPVRR
jgi:hypothetical protein